MPVNPGSRLGPYEVIALIGSGGMGEVYRATDVNLKRTVAIKVLPAAFAADADRLARFQREAEVLARLNHPHIAQIHGLEKSGDTIALVMELVDGPTLADRIAQGPIPVDEALAIARQIAEALQAAHDQHIIHRDLKPANIKTRPDGTVKVLDFGLAKALEPETVTGELSNSPTITSPAMTQMGMILGTAAFMAPEQAKGQPADKRADVWAFGCVLYEMLTGRRAFAGDDDASDTLASVLKTDPDWRALPADLPPAIRLLIERSLVKDRRRRVGDISTALFLLNEALSMAPPPAGPAVRPQLTGRLVAGAVICLAAGAALATLVLRGIERPAAPVTQRLSLALAADRAISLGWFPGSSLAISPDGTEVVYVSTNPGAPPDRADQLRVRTLASRGVVDLPGTFRARQPFFSPDGRSVAFFTVSGELKKISLSGGNPVTLVDKINASAWSFGVWTDPNTIVFGGVGTAGLQLVPADGGSVRALTSLDVAQGEAGHYPGAFVPEAGAVVFSTAFGQLREPRLEAVIVQSGDRRVVVENASSGRYLSTGHLFFRRGDAVFFAPFDVKRLAVSGPAVAVSEDILRDGANSEGTVPQVAISSNGTLAYIPRSDSARAIGRVSVSGAFERISLPGRGRVRRPRVSPDGQRLAFEMSTDNAPLDAAVHIYDLARGTVTRLDESGSESQPVWQVDGKGIAVFARRQDASGIYVKNLTGGERLVLRNEGPLVAFRLESFSPDGTVLAYTRQRGSQHSIWLLTLADTPAARQLSSSTASEYSPKFSPDGRWLAYTVGEVGATDVYVRGYPQGQPIPVSASGGSGPVWSRDGRTLFYESSSSGEPALLAVSVTPVGGTLKLGTPTRVFSMRAPESTGLSEEYNRSFNWGPEYDVFPDGSFAMVRGPGPGSAREIVLVQHWFEEVKRLAPAPR